MSDIARHAETLTADCSAQRIMLDQQLALSAYLDALLQPPPTAPTTVVVADPEPPRTTLGDAAAPESSAAVAAAAIETHTEAETAADAPAPAADYPEWAQHDFQCLLFRVAGLTLALPLAKLNGVLRWDAAAVTSMPNHRPWFLGLREHLGHQVKLIDVAKVVTPSDRATADAAGAGFGHIILIDEGHWGLVCSEVADVVTLSATAVKWRSPGGSRPWLAGTVIDRMCALLDCAVLADMLGGAGPHTAAEAGSVAR